MRQKILILIVLVVAMISGCGAAAGNYENISQEDAAKIMQTEKNILVVDVRTPEEYAKKHIPNAVLLPVDDIQNGKLELLPDKNQKILIYCWTGRRAENAAKILAKNGYTNVYNFGGLVDWEGEVEGAEVLTEN